MMQKLKYINRDDIYRRGCKCANNDRNRAFEEKRWEISSNFIGRYFPYIPRYFFNPIKLSDTS